MLYTKGVLSRKLIAQNVGTTEKTLRSWIESEGWDEQRQMQTITRPQLLQDAYRQLKALNDFIDEKGGIPDKSQSDAKAVLIREIELFSIKPLHKYIEVVSEFVDYIQKNKPDLLMPVLEISDLFINQVAREKGV